MPDDPTPLPGAVLDAALIVIGNEILSGRTQDANIRFLAGRLGAIGLPLREVRIIPDVADTIVATVNELRARYGQVFTTGGIGPTHDDITSECVAAAFGVPWERHPQAEALLRAAIPPERINEAVLRMATIPRGARLVDNPVSAAPGFSIGNVHVMAGVPSIMRAMFDKLEPGLPHGPPVVMRSVYATDLREGQIAAGLAAIADDFPDVDIGSYPFRLEGHVGVALVSKGGDAARVEAAHARNVVLLRGLDYEPVEGEPPVRQLADVELTPGTAS